jgi:hypothetical protein
MHNIKTIRPVGLKIYKKVGQPCNYAPWGLLVDLFSICKVPDLVKMFSFQLVAHVAQTIFDLKSKD